MRILKILNGNDDGGVFTCETEYITYFKQQGVSVDAIIVGKGKSFEKYKNIVDSVFELPEQNVRFIGSISKIFKSISKARKYAKKHSPEIFKVYKGSYDAIIYRRVTYLYIAGILGKHYKTTAFWFMPNAVNNGFSRIFYNIELRRLKIQPIANSLFTKNTLGTHCKYVTYPGYKKERVLGGESIYRNKLNIESDVPVFGMAARLHYDKAQDIVIQAFMESKAIERGAHLLIAGSADDENYEKSLKDLCGDLLNVKVHFLGKINDLNNLYASIDIFINGRRNAEPFGISIAESLGAGKPVIAYYLGGPSEMVTENVTGWLVEYPKKENYKAAINQSLDAKERWNEMSKSCCDESLRFGTEDNAKKQLDILKNQLI